MSVDGSTLKKHVEAIHEKKKNYFSSSCDYSKVNRIGAWILLVKRKIFLVYMIKRISSISI